MTRIHSTAVVESGAELGEDTEVGPHCYVGPHVVLGPRCRLRNHATVTGHTTAGADNVFYANTVIGEDPQDLKYHGEPTKLVIGDRNEFRESVTVHRGTEVGGGVTQIGNNNHFMVGAHIAHDSHIGNHCVLANNALLAGHIVIRDHATLSGGAAVHHFVTIGRYAFVGGNAGVVHDVPPFMVSDGHPAQVRSVNRIGLQRHQFDPDTLSRLQHAYRMLYKREGPRSGFRQALDRVDAEINGDPAIRELVQFLRQSDSGINGRYREAQRADNKRANAPR